MKFPLLLSAVYAHFEMLRPVPRVVGDMAEQKIPPCAGAFNPANRMPFSIANSSIELTFYWDGDNDVYFGFGENPDTFPFKVGSLLGAKAGATYTVPLDFSDIPGFENGAYGTIQAVCHQPKFDIYQCADVALDGATSTVTKIPITTKTLTSATGNPTLLLQKLTTSLTGHLELPNGCTRDETHMNADSPSKNFAALWLRAVFHDIGKHEPGAPAAGLLPDFLEESENLGIGESIATNFAPLSVFNYSRADIIALAGQVTVSHCGGPQFEYSLGRIDADKTPFLNLPALPDDAKDSYEKMKDRLHKLGLDDRDVVALVTGSHSLGGVHNKISPHATNKTFEPFDDTPGVFDNNIFQRSLENNCRLNIDCSIAADPLLRPIVKEFAEDEQAFFKQYQVSYKKLTSIGSNLTEYVNLNIPVHKNLVQEGGTMTSVTVTATKTTTCIDIPTSTVKTTGASTCFTGIDNSVALSTTVSEYSLQSNQADCGECSDTLVTPIDTVGSEYESITSGGKAIGILGSFGLITFAFTILT